MTASKAQVQELFDALLSLESEVKDINEDKKNLIKNFSREHGINVKAVAKAFGDYKVYLKDQQTFHEVDGDTDILLGTLIDEVA